MPKVKHVFCESNFTDYFKEEFIDVLFEDKDYIAGYRAAIMDVCHYFNIDNSKILVEE